jgi:putative MATE family efflux protein
MLNIILGLVVTVISFVFLDPILYALGASKQTLPYAREFMQVILIGNLSLHLYLGLNNIMRSSGYPHKAMYITLITVGINLLLAPLFIFVFKWGIRGAALATVLAQLAGTILGLLHFFRRESIVRFLPGYMRLKKEIVKEIFSIGMAIFLMLISASLVVLLINRSLEKYGGDFAIGAFGIINSILSLVTMIVLGFNQGMQPIAGYNFGAHQPQRVKRVFRITLMAGTIVTTFGFLVSEVFPRQIAAVFTVNQELISLSATGLQYAMLLFPIVGFQMVTASFFQSIGKARVSILWSLSRQVLFLIPAILILSHFFGLKGIWIGMPVADLLASVLTFVVLRHQMGKLGI